MKQMRYQTYLRVSRAHYWQQQVLAALLVHNFNSIILLLACINWNVFFLYTSLYQLEILCLFKTCCVNCTSLTAINVADERYLWEDHDLGDAWGVRGGKRTLLHKLCLLLQALKVSIWLPSAAGHNILSPY